ncbi:MATE family efflux transporter [Flavobacterium sedimenticola]|uniref:Polysaccharide biosynthesis protein C-terminal domain-containing protein n=1 Tax=Flavobacterium sedimenticola TaxID=3043286 RepID=A0ABT6XL80_9FLAO|nr:hypothetical protein [Flavobacterium sedimenticola]MDI9255839.1 hypothetical protein [Flavobacterium sedimenticola]
MKSKQVIAMFNVAFRQMVSTAFNVLLPFVVIHFAEKQIWGEFVSILLFILMASACNNFGHKEYLLRQFSAEPGKIRRYFTQNLYSRVPILLLSVACTLLLFPVPQAFFISLSLIGLFVSQSFEALIVFEKRFRLSAIIEMVTGVILLSAIYVCRESITALLIVKLYAGFLLLKALVYVYLFFSFFEKKQTRLSFYILKKSFPFFLLTLAGFLASKNDVYLVHFFLSKPKLAEYQILNNLCLFAMGTAGFFYIPFTKNIYRNSEVVIVKLQRILIIMGFLITISAVAVIFLVVTFYLKTTVPDYFYAIVFGYIFPSFVYGIKIIMLSKQHKEILVTTYLITGIVINVVLSALFLNLGLDITGALLGSAVAQWVVLGLFLKPMQEHWGT